MATVLLYIGRIFFGGYFIMGGINHFRHLEMMSGYAQSKGTPYPKYSVAFSGILLLIGGASLLLNVLPGLGLISLVLFLVPVTIIMHAPWKVQDPQAKMSETINFMKNIALLGAVLILLAYVIA
jgi:putative oxidoreductase